MLERELFRDRNDIALLMLERMRLIDTFHNWRTSTLGVYGLALK